jgi:hypothetical protein
MRDFLIFTAGIFLAVALAIPAGGMLSDWLLHAGIWPVVEWHP